MKRIDKLLQALIDTRDGVPVYFQGSKVYFNMRQWLDTTSNYCGTSACAAGEYVLRNPDCGLEFTPHYCGRYSIREVGGFGNTSWNSRKILAPHFGITEVESDHLFLNTHINLKQVIDRVTDLIAKYKLTNRYEAMP